MPTGGLPPLTPPRPPREVGRVGLRAFISFEVLSTLALIVGLVVVNVVRPGAGLNVDLEQARDVLARHGEPDTALEG